MRRLKIVEIIGEFWTGGTERILLDTLSRFNQDDFDIHVWSTLSRGLADVEALFVNAGISTEYVPCNRGHSLAGMIQIIKFAKYLKQFKFDIAHTHGFNNNLYARLAAVLARVPVIITHDHNVPSESVQSRILWNALNHFTYKNIAVTESVADYRRAYSKNFDNKIITILNGIDLKRFIRPSKEEELQIRRSLGFSEQDSLIGTASRLVESKRLDLFLDAASILLMDLPRTQFIIAGVGPAKKALVKHAQQLGIERNVKFIGWISDSENLLKVIDALIVTSEEGFGLTMVEAMACETPVIAVRHKTSEEILDRCGVLVDGSPDAIAIRVKELLVNPEFSKEMGDCGRQRAIELFDVSRTAEMISSLYLKAYSEKIERIRA